MTTDLNLINWLLACLPIIALIVLMVGRNWTAQQAGTLGIFIAAGVALLVFGASMDQVSLSAAMGVWDSFPILYVVWPALLLYHIMNESGGYDALRHGISRISKNELFIVIALGWVFVSFLQGVDGFGTPIAVVAPLLLALGMKPVYAVALPIIGHIWDKFYGTLGVGWLATLSAVGDGMTGPEYISMGVQAGLLMLIQAVSGGFMVAWMYGRWNAIREGWPLILIIAAIQGVGQVLMVWVDPILAAFLPSAVALIALFPLARWKRYHLPTPKPYATPAMAEHHEASEADQAEPPMGVVAAMSPYLIITVLALATSLIQPLGELLGQFAVNFKFPVLDAAGNITGAVRDYAPLRVFTHPGTAIFIAALVAWAYFESKDYFSTWCDRTGRKMGNITLNMFKTSVPASVPIVAFLVMASIMKYSGQTTMLAHGIAAVAPTYVFAFVANGIGVLGAFMTSSSTSSQVVFSELQVELAKLKGLPATTILAAQAAGGGIGNAIAPANIVMGASTTGIVGKEGAILRETIPWTIVNFVLTGLATIGLALLFK